MRQTLDSLLGDAVRHRQAGRLGRAEQALRRAVLQAPDDPRLLHDLALVRLELGEAASALVACDRAVAGVPGFAPAHFRRGQALEMLGLGGAEEAYRRAMGLGFASAELFSSLARLLHREGRREEAGPVYARAAALAPGQFSALVDGGQAALIGGRNDEAFALFSRAEGLRPGAPDVHGHLAHILAARGDFAGAGVQVERALLAEPGRVGLFYDLVKTRHVTPDDTALVARMRAALSLKAAVPERLKLHLALAKAFDDLGDFAAAAAELDRADVLREGESRFDRALVEAQTARIEALFTPACMAHPQHSGRESHLPILVVGMPRSGTTLVERILAAHPACAGAGEVHFWEAQGLAYLDVATPGMGADLRAVADAYLVRLRQVSATASRIVDKMPTNARWAPLVHLALPNARIVHCRRNEADTCLSVRFANLAETEGFSAARRHLPVVWGQYRRLADHARGLLPGSRWLDVDYEALVTQPEPVVRGLLAFCGLEWNAACLSPERAGGSVHTFSQFQVRQGIFGSSVGRGGRYREEGEGSAPDPLGA